MSIFGKLFEKKPTEEVLSLEEFFDNTLTFVLVTKAMCVRGDTMHNALKRKIVFCYFLGFVDFVGQSQEFPKDDIMDVTGRIFIEAFGLNGEEAEKALECVMDASQESEGRQYIMAGAMALEDFLYSKTKTASLPLMSLLAKV